MYRFRWFPRLLVGLAAMLSSCSTQEIPTQPPQSPEAYLSNALDWIETHSVKIHTVDWATVRKEALALAPNPRTTADTYPGILYVTKELGDAATFFVPPEEEAQGDVGFQALYPDAVVVEIDPGGPAEKAGLQIGDVITAINGAPPKQYQGTPFLDLYNDPTLHMAVHRMGQDQPVQVTLTKAKSSPHLSTPKSTPTGQRIASDRGSVGYIELPVETGEAQLYPTLAQQVIRESDQQGTCGWIVDLRRTTGGDIWSYLAAIGPILGEGEVGAFVYLDGTREPWKYQSGKVYWNGQARYESLVEGTIYRLRHPMAPVAVLISRATLAAGELAVVAFEGRQGVRTFGEPTGGSPLLVIHTQLSDGAFLGVSGAASMDRTGHTYDGSILPDQAIRIDWTLFGTEHDPVILAARDWLLGEPACRHP